MSLLAEHYDELAAVRAGLAAAWRRQGDIAEAEKHEVAARFYSRAAAEQRLAEAGLDQQVAA